jgi:hypothetical protein
MVGFVFEVIGLHQALVDHGFQAVVCLAQANAQFRWSLLHELVVFADSMYAITD